MGLTVPGWCRSRMPVWAHDPNAVAGHEAESRAHDPNAVAGHEAESNSLSA